MYQTYEDLPDNEMKKRIAQYRYDYFFHYLLIVSEMIRLLLCRYLSGDQSIRETYLENNETYIPFYKGKKLIMDVVIRDDKGRYYNFEMQNGTISEDDEIRFARYLERLMDCQDIKGQEYKDLKDVYQLIIYTGKPIVNFHHYEHNIRRGDFKHMIPLNIERTHSVILQLKNMEKDLNLEKQLTPINQLMYLLINNVIHKKSEISPEVEEAMNIHNQYMRSNEVIKGYEMERERMVITGRMNRAKEEGIELGKSEGIEIGKTEGIEKGIEIGKNEGIELGELKAKQQDVIKLIEALYGEVDKEFVYRCTVEQLSRAFSLIKLDYETFKEKLIEK